MSLWITIVVFLKFAIIKIMLKDRKVILIIIAVVIVLGFGGYIAYRHFYPKKTIPNLSSLIPTSTPITITSQENKSNYIPPEIAAVLNLSAYKVDSQIRQLSNGGTQYILSFEVSDIKKATDNIRSQLQANKFIVSNSTSTNFGAYNSLSNTKVQVIAISPSIFRNPTSSAILNLKPAITISWYNEKQQ